MGQHRTGMTARLLLRVDHHKFLRREMTGTGIIILAIIVEPSYDAFFPTRVVVHAIFRYLQNL